MLFKNLNHLTCDFWMFEVANTSIYTLNEVAPNLGVTTVKNGVTKTITDFLL